MLSSFGVNPRPGELNSSATGMFPLGPSVLVLPRGQLGITPSAAFPLTPPIAEQLLGVLQSKGGRYLPCSLNRQNKSKNPHAKLATRR